MTGEPDATTQSDQLLGTLATEQINPATTGIDHSSPLDIARLMNVEDVKVAGAVQQELLHIARAIEGSAARLRQGGRLIYMGAGTSGRLGVLDASECPPTFSVSPELIVGQLAGGLEAFVQASEGVEDSFEAGQDDAAQLHITARDAVVGIAASGRTPYVMGAIAYARQQQALTIGLACNKRTPLEEQVDIMIAPETGPEVIAGSTRLKAGTAQKMVLNMLSTGTMITLGKTFKNLMVEVQATNHKLRRRASKIVQLATGLAPEAADALLQASNGETKTAILSHLGRLTPEQARARLQEHGGVLRDTLAASEDRHE
ncbi:MAG TPA: N-acetylmuramic acid 6-phosphate etherase [Ktedonobacteraceae bacterium]|jgi:N-acetylmuramic acid 6-phosphate etherase